jgi:anthranilate synthase component 1
MTGTGFTATPIRLPAGFDLLGLHRLAPSRYPVLLESTAHGSRQGRYDILLAFPGDELRRTGPDPGRPFLAELDAAWDAGRHPPASPDAPPFRGGWFVFLGYELRSEVEPSTGVRLPPRGPVALALRFPAALVRDRLRGDALVVVEAGADACRAEIERDLAALPPAVDPAGPLVTALTEPAPEAFLAAVDAARALIARGDLYQANLSRRWHGRLRPGAGVADVYARLRRTNPAPFAGLVDWPGLALASSSPERLVRIAGDQVETRPIAGTRPVAGAAPGVRQRELLASAKERAEHVMLIDLERNDLGRVCAAGSVNVAEYMSVETYAHVHHIVSGVTGELRPGVSPGEVLAAVFPGGTITGCPKVRCLAAIDRLEGAGRGAYTGSMGYLNHDGSGDLNILIRTIEVEDDRLSFAAGSGIVADSDAQRELEETRAKARGLVLAVTAP